MHPGGAQIGGKRVAYPNLDLADLSTSVLVTHSDSILRDIRVPLIPNRMGRRQTEQTGLRGTKIPCFRVLYNLKHFPIWNQSVAAVVEEDSRQLKVVQVRPQEAECAVATLCEICASFPYGESHQTSDVDSMAYPEV